MISSTGVAGIAHITGGGIEGNTRRLLHGDLELAINWSAWERPAIFNLIQRSGNVPEEDMRRTFNLGVGLVFIMPETDVEKLNALIDEHGFPSFNIGDVASLVKFYIDNLPIKLKSFQVAAVLHEAIKDMGPNARFWETYARNRGYDFKIFYSMENALKYMQTE